MPNFRIYSFGPRPLDRQVATQIEALRGAGVTKLVRRERDRRWTPKCTLVLHGTRASYRQCVPGMADCTIASCTIRADGPRISERRIDVRTRLPAWLEYLPHELTHLVLRWPHDHGNVAAVGR